tara:strand:+ start:745 stop:1296 length:552 start_codon:yes stop_codon:yes gene_type:complete
MEIRSIKYLIASVFFSLQIYGSDDSSNFKTFYVIEANQVVTSRSIDNKSPLKSVVLDFSTIVSKSNEVVNSLDTLASNYDGLDKSDVRELLLQPGEYIRIKDKGSVILLSDGSFFVKFKEMPFFEDFALLNDVIFITDLSDINMGVFKVENMYELESKLEMLKEDDNILMLELNTINPSVVPK